MNFYEAFCTSTRDAYHNIPIEDLIELVYDKGMSDVELWIFDEWHTLTNLLKQSGFIWDNNTTIERNLIRWDRNR